MSIPKIKEFSDYNKYATEPDYTTSAQAQEYYGNQNECLKSVMHNYWQPETNYAFGEVVYSPAFPRNVEALCVKAGKTSNVEPGWGSVGGSDVIDGTVKWQLQYKDATKNGKVLGTRERAANKPTYGL